MSRNTMYLQDIVKGNYGRKIAYADVEEINETNILPILGKSIGIFNSNKTVVDYLWRYKNGDQPVLYRKKKIRDDIVNKVVENHAYEIVQFKVAQSYGEPLQYVSTSDVERVNNAVDKLNMIMASVFKYQRNIKQGEWRSAVGTSFLATQRTGREKKIFRLTVPTPMNTFIIYSSFTEEPLMAVQHLKEYVDSRREEYYYLCFTDTMQYKIKNGKIVDKRLHVFGGIPIVEIPNNQDRLSDVEIVITMLDAINEMQSNRMDGIQQFIQSWMKFVNCEIDEETFRKMKTNGALVVKSNNGDGNKADVDVMTQELDQTQSQVAKDDLWNNALSILAIPNKEGNTGGDTQGAVELRNGWDFSKNRAKLSDAYIIEAETRLAEVALNILRIGGQDLGITTDDFTVNIPHSPQDNMTVKANVLNILLQAGIHPLIAIKVCGLWNDAEKVYLLSKPYLDVLHKTVDDLIKEIPDADEQITKAVNIKKDYEENNNPQSKLKERLMTALG